ncbi:MAG: EamA family transporter [Actinomycetes bacterium]
MSLAAIVFGSLTALLWAGSSLASSRSVRYIGQYSVVAWVMLVGTVVTVPFTIASGVPATLDQSALLALIAIGASALVGLLLMYAALRVGKVTVVGPIAATEGAVAALLSALAGEPLAPLAAALLLLVVGGVMLSTLAPDPSPITDERPVRAAILASIAALMFGISLFLSGRLSLDLPISWVVLPPRILGTLTLFLPLLVTGSLRITRKALPLVISTGLTEVLGFATFSLGARTSLATVAVLASQVATFTVIGGWILFRERLGRVQALGIAIVILGITGLALTKAT